MSNEIWKPVKGYEGLYEVSNLGRVRSLDRLVNCGKNKVGFRTRKGKILSNCIKKDGYHSVRLPNFNGEYIHYSVHRLVAQAFIPNPDNKPCIDHLNTNQGDNRVENLRWVTYKENSNNPLTLKKISNANIGKGEKRVIQYTTYDNQPIAYWNSLKECSKFTGIPRSTISNNLTGRIKTVTNKEFYFKYE